MSTTEHTLVRLTLTAWIVSNYQICGCCSNCSKHVEFLWRPRFKQDLVGQFLQAEPWIHISRLELRKLLCSVLAELGYVCVLADVSAKKVQVRFPDGHVHRVTGIAMSIHKRLHSSVLLAKSTMRSPKHMQRPVSKRGC